MSTYGNFSKLKEIIEKGEISAVISPGFPLPNETIKRLYYDYIKQAYRKTGVFNLDLSKYSELMPNLAYDGQWEPLFNYICDLLRQSMSLRDLITGEKSVQAFLNVYLVLSNLFIIHTEKELNKGYGKDPGNKVSIDILRFGFGLYRLK